MSQAIIIKNKVAIAKMREAGKRLASILASIDEKFLEGRSTWEIDAFIEQKMVALGLKAPCKGYAGYAHATCISVNDVVVHGIPTKETVLKAGDFVTIDVVGSFKDYCADMARYYFVGGKKSALTEKLAKVAQQSLDHAISLIKPGLHLSTVSFNIQKIVEQNGFNVIRDFVGHGIGKSFHEAPEVPNFGDPGQGPLLREGMALAIEPMIVEKDYRIQKLSDGWTIKTLDGGLAAHVEDTIVVTSNGAEVLTRV